MTRLPSMLGADAARAATDSASRCDGNSPQGTAGASDDFQRRCNDDRSGRRKLIEIAQTGQTKLAAAVHEVVIRKRRVKRGGLPGIGSNRLHADAQHISLLRKKRGAFLGQARSVRSILLEVDVLLGVLPLRPVCAQQNPCARPDTTVLFFPLSNAFRGQQIVRVLRHLRTNVDYACTTDKFLRRDAVHGVVRKIFPRNPVDWSIEMSAGVLAGLECIPVPGRTALIVMRQLPTSECRSVVELLRQRAHTT